MENSEMTDFDNSFDFGDVMNNEEQENETPAESSTENNETENDPSQEGEESVEESEESIEESEETTENTLDANKNIPLNKEKRWQEMQAKNELMAQQLREQKELVDKLLSANQTASKKDEEIPKSFLETFGSGDPEMDKQAWSKYRNLHNEMKQEILNEIREEKAKESKQIDEFNYWVDSQVAEFKAQGESISREDFIKIVQEFEPSKGLETYDQEKVMKIYKLQKELADLKLSKEKEKDSQVSKAKKKNASMSSGTKTTENKDSFSLEDSSLFRQMFRK